MTDLLINGAYDEPTKLDYLFDNREALKKEDAEYSEGTGTARPKDKVTVWSQGSSPACTSFAEGHITNGNNILEDMRIGESRPQMNPMMPRDDFCKGRNNWNTGTSIQSMAQFYAKNKFIQGYVTIPNTQTDLANKMRLALDNGNFLVTGSSNGDWGMIGKTGVYSIKTDGKVVGHSFSIVSYESDGFWAINSRGPKRGPFGGYFKIPNDMVHELYSKLAIIDWNDGVYFQRLKNREKAHQILSLCKDLYQVTDEEVKKYFDGIQIGANLIKFFG